MAVNCGAIPPALAESEFFGHQKGAFSGADAQKPGKLELASGGTLFLDEVGELSLALQVKLLRALEQKSFYRLGGVKPIEVNFRLLSATHRDLEALCRSGEFREDFYYRINVLELELQPLRERTEDIEPLAMHLLGMLNEEMNRDTKGIEAEVISMFKAYGWPGNVREMRNILERMLVRCERGFLGIRHVPVELFSHSRQQGTGTSLAEQIRDLERKLISDVMRRTRGKKIEAARMLGISRPTLDKKLSSLEIDWLEART